MAFTGEQAAGGVQANPAGARQVNLAPGMQIGEIHLGAGRAVEGFHIGFQLDQVAGNKARRQAQVAEQLHQQPSRIAAGAGAFLQAFFRSLHARLKSNQVADIGGQALIQRHQKIHARQRRALDAGQVLGKQLAGRQLDQIRRQLQLLALGIGERDFLGVRLKEEIEGVEHRHFGDQIHLNLQLAGLLRKHQSRQVVALRVLLPVDKVLARFDLQRVGQNPGAAVRCRTQAHDLRAKIDRAVVAIVADMVQGDMNRHSGPPASLGDNQAAQDLCQ